MRLELCEPNTWATTVRSLCPDVCTERGHINPALVLIGLSEAINEPTMEDLQPPLF